MPTTVRCKRRAMGGVVVSKELRKFIIILQKYICGPPPRLHNTTSRECAPSSIVYTIRGKGAPARRRNERRRWTLRHEARARCDVSCPRVAAVFRRTYIEDMQNFPRPRAPVSPRRLSAQDITCRHASRKLIYRKRHVEVPYRDCFVGYALG